MRNVILATAMQELIATAISWGEIGRYGNRNMRPHEKYMRNSRYMPHHGNNVRYDLINGQIKRTKLKAA